MLFGLFSLCKYNKGFKLARNTLLLWLTCSVFSLALNILGTLGAAVSLSNSLKIPLRIASYGFEMLFVLFLLTGVEMIAKETSLPKLISKARRQRAVSVVYYALIFLTISSFGSTDSGKILGIILYVFGTVFKFFIVSSVWTCYVRICLKGDEDMPERPLKFKWMNNWRNFYNKSVFSQKSKETNKSRKGKKKNGKK